MATNKLSITQEVLLQKYGCLLDLAQLAEVLHRHPKGLRWQLSVSKQAWVCQLRAARVRIGRRVLFEVASVAAVIDASRSLPTDAPTDAQGFEGRDGTGQSCQ